MRLQLRCHGDIDLSQPGMQVEIRSHIARCLRDYPNGGEGGLPPEKWSSLMYGLWPDGGLKNGKEATHGGRDRHEAAAG